MNNEIGIDNVSLSTEDIFKKGIQELRDLREDEYEHDKFCNAVDVVLTEFAEMLKEKNRKYGNSALHPIRVFSKADAKEQIKVRLDDKISRLIRGTGNDTEDVYLDLTGYLILYMILDRQLL